MIKSLLKDVAIYGFSDFIFKLISFVVFPVYTHLFSVSDYGCMSLVGVTIGLIGLLSNLGINNAVQRFFWEFENEDRNRSVMISSSLIGLTCISILISIVCLIIAYVFRFSLLIQNGISFSIFAYAVCAIVFDQQLQFLMDLSRVKFKPVDYLMISFSKNLLGVIIGLLLIIYLKWGLEGYFIGNLVASGSASICAIMWTKYVENWQFNLKHFKPVIKYGYPFVFSGIAYWLFGSMDRWMLASMKDNNEVGLYSVAFKFSSVLAFLNAAFSQAWSPFALKLLKENEHHKKIYGDVLNYWFFVLNFLSLGLVIIIPDILKLTTPSSYWPAGSLVGVVALSTVLLGTTQITASGISISMKSFYFTRVAWTAAGLNFILNYLLIPKMGAMGSALATLFANGLITILYFILTQKLYPITFSRRFLLFNSIVFLLILSLSLFMPEFVFQSYTIRLLVIVIIGISPFLFKFINFNFVKKIIVSKG